MRSASAREGTKQQIAFYGSTPAYRGVLELHGWGDLQDDLNRLSKQGEWTAMGDLITDEILETFAVVADPEDIPKALLARFGDVVDRLSFYAPYQSDPDRWKQILAGFKGDPDLRPGPQRWFRQRAVDVGEAVVGCERRGRHCCTRTLHHLVIARPTQRRRARRSAATPRSRRRTSPRRGA